MQESRGSTLIGAVWLTKPSGQTVHQLHELIDEWCDASRTHGVAKQLGVSLVYPATNGLVYQSLNCIWRGAGRYVRAVLINVAPRTVAAAMQTYLSTRQLPLLPGPVIATG